MKDDAASAGRPRIPRPAADLHLDAEGRARMVDIGGKEPTARSARAQARLRMLGATLDAIEGGLVKKGDVLAVSQVAGVMAAKKTPDLIPLCHPLELSSVQISFAAAREGDAGILTVTADVSCVGRTGVEMEAMVAAATAALTVYDMVKGIDRWVTIEGLRLLEKSGGKSGHLVRA